MVTPPLTKYTEMNIKGTGEFNLNQNSRSMNVIKTPIEILPISPAKKIAFFLKLKKPKTVIPRIPKTRI